MKKGIHPEYHRCKVTCISCGNTFETGSVLKEIRVDTCSKCHSFYTGKAGTIVSDGRIDRFNKKYQAPAAEAKTEAPKTEEAK